MMRTKTVIAVVLTLLTCVPVVSRTPFRKNVTIDSCKVDTPEEELEAKRLAVQVISQLDISDNFAPLLRRFFIKDFVIRLRKNLLDKSIDPQAYAQYGIERRVLAQATNNDLKRAYVAMMNAWNQYDQFEDVVRKYMMIRNNVDWVAIFGPKYQNELVATNEEQLTPLFFKIAESHPLLSFLVASVILKVELKEDVYNSKLEAATIRTVTGLRAFTIALAKCVDLMRSALKRLRATKNRLSAGRLVERKSERETKYIYKYWSEILEKKENTFSAGTKFYYARITPFEIVMTRRNGRLKIAAIYPDFDGD